MSVSIVWLDQDVAKIFHFSDDRMEREVLQLGSAWAESCDRLAGHLANSHQIVLLSPGDAGRSLAQGIQLRFPEVAKRIVGNETLREADDAAIAEYAIKYFRRPLKRSV